MKIGDLVRLSDDLAGAVGILVEKKQDAELSKILWADVGFSWEKNSRILVVNSLEKEEFFV
jgi:hypothetical protein